MHDLIFNIKNLTCDACVKVSMITLRKLPGVTDVSVDISTGAARLTSEKLIHPNDVTEALKNKGYDVAF
ncbi:MAG: heavy metal transport/detoxification protein [Candidatus Uhrbacteria bacterium GW2011_GWF2_41_16]|uniref:Heavy metal transport/detoxification protein n=2 Tax=Candidatus Uhriibacteriota TaxID=1752732 RepID=A0A0G0VB36_9BACT|nr:MAG: heavy metal transport/detoxification protein [Candidatus Uhrbacteria bacterium GW2011_GWF2_41_16]